MSLNVVHIGLSVGKTKLKQRKKEEMFPYKTEPSKYRDGRREKKRELPLSFPFTYFLIHKFFGF